MFASRGVSAASLSPYSDPANGVPLLPGTEPEADPQEAGHDPDPFGFNAEISGKLSLWVGELWRLQADAVVSVGNEDFGHRTGSQASALWQHAGSSLRGAARQAVEGTGKIDCGDAVSTPAFKLPASHIIHTVSPMFDLKFKTASESALASSYWSCLSCLKELGGHSIAFDVIHALDKKYPIEAGAHIAARTIRRFLNTHGDAVTSTSYLLFRRLHV